MLTICLSLLCSMIMSSIKLSQDLDEIEFRFKDKVNPMSYTAGLSASLDVSSSITIPCLVRFLTTKGKKNVIFIFVTTKSDFN